MDNYLIEPELENTMAAWLDGMLSQEESDAFMRQCANDPMMQDILDANDDVEDAFESMIEMGYELPVELDGDFEIPQVDGLEYSSDYADSSDYHEIEPYDEPSNAESTDTDTDTDDDIYAENHMSDSDDELSSDSIHDCDFV